MFVIHGVDDKFWNQIEFVKYLVDNQNNVIELTTFSEAIDLENLGVYQLLDLFKFKQVIINTWNPFEKHDRYEIRFPDSTFWFTRISDINPTLHNWDQQKIFLCFYHRPTASRLALAGHLNQYYCDQSIIHFSTDIKDNTLMQFEFDKLLKYDISSVPPAAALLQSLPILQGSRERHTRYHGYDYEDPLTAMYTHTLIDLVGETHVLGRTFFPTEKTTRPILLKKPFIVFGSRNYLAYMRQMGFQTFHGFWDEDYDGFETKDRLLRIYQVIQNIAAQSHGELVDMYQRMQPVLEHNYNLLMSQSYTKTLKEIS